MPWSLAAKEEHERHGVEYTLEALKIKTEMDALQVKIDDIKGILTFEKVCLGIGAFTIWYADTYFFALRKTGKCARGIYD